MTVAQLILGVVVLIFILLFAFFPEFRSLLKGFGGIFVKDLATTPEGARAIYAEKIDEARDAYNKADDAYKSAQGKLVTEQRKLENLKTRLSACEKDCENLVKAGKIDHAQVKADERAEIKDDIARSEKLIQVYGDAAAQAKEIFELCEKNLKKIKKEAKDVVDNMIVKDQMKKVYDDMDDLKNETGTDKMLEAIREKNQDLDSIVEGSKAVHAAKASTKSEKASKEAQRLQSNDYLEELKKKYNK